MSIYPQAGTPTSSTPRTHRSRRSKLQAEQLLQAESANSDQAAEYVTDGDDQIELVLNHVAQDFLDTVDAERHDFALDHRLHVELFYQLGKLIVHPLPDHWRGLRREPPRRFGILLRFDIAEDIRDRLL